MDQREQHLWETAKARASFKFHIVVYIVINAFFWCLWWFTDSAHESIWPIYPMLGWGIGLFFHYFQAYHSKNKLVQKEYEKLKKEQEN